MQILTGDCLAILPTLDDSSIDAIVTDPPYCLTSITKRFGSPTAKPAALGPHQRTSRGFMGQQWDNDIAFRPDVWAECLRVLKPGGHLIAFGGSRTHHRLWCAIEDAGFELRETLMWLYSTGFPKSLDVSKAIDKHLGAAREVVGASRDKHYSSEGVTSGASIGGQQGGYNYQSIHSITAPATPEAAQWDGWGTALSPSHEPIVLARKPLGRSTVAENVMAYGTGALNIDASRVPGIDPANERRLGKSYGDVASDTFGQVKHAVVGGNTLGRWPKNILHDGSDEVVALFPQSKSTAQPRHNGARAKSVAKGHDYDHVTQGYDDEGSAARFFYTAKPSKRERGEGNVHPCVKPLALMRYLCKLVTPPGGTILDPFAGSGSTGVAAVQEGFVFIGIESSAEYAAIACRRCCAARQDSV
jgi:DNA modification methylase